VREYAKKDAVIKNLDNALRGATVIKEEDRRLYVEIFGRGWEATEAEQRDLYRNRLVDKVVIEELLAWYNTPGKSKTESILCLSPTEFFIFTCQLVGRDLLWTESKGLILATELFRNLALLKDI
jgi:hypothetical protein